LFIFIGFPDTAVKGKHHALIILHGKFVFRTEGGKKLQGNFVSGVHYEIT
jgi:hypothetical protein